MYATWKFLSAGMLLLASIVALAASPTVSDEARHLLNRKSFAANIDDINAVTAGAWHSGHP